MFPFSIFFTFCPNILYMLLSFLLSTEMFDISNDNSENSLSIYSKRCLIQSSIYEYSCWKSREFPEMSLSPLHLFSSRKAAPLLLIS